MKAVDSSPTFLGRLRFEHIFLVIFIVALILRFFLLDLKLFHHDEAVHAWFSFKLLTEGTYVYDPVYHGPLLYYTTASMFALFGDSDLVGRIIPALLGSLMVALVWPIYRLGYLGKCGALIAALFLAISPDMVYFSRFLRNDIFVAFFTLLLLVALLYYLEYGQRRYVVVAALAAGLGCCAKENMPIILLIFGVFLAAAVILKWVHLRKGWWMDLILGLVVMLAVGSLLYSSFGAHPDVLWTGAFQAIEHWTAMSSQQRLGGPPYFYILLFLLYEVPVIFLALVGTVQAVFGAVFLWKRRRHSGVADISAPAVAVGDNDGMADVDDVTGVADVVVSSGDVAGEFRTPVYPEIIEPATAEPVTAECTSQYKPESGYAEEVEGREEAEGLSPAEESGGQVTRQKCVVSRLVDSACAGCRDVDRPGFDRRLGFAVFCIWWMCASLGVYAVIGEKVPWLILHQLLPMIFVAVYMMTRKKATFALILSVFLVVMMVHVVFTPADINEPIVQVQNSEELRVLFRLIDAGNSVAVTPGSVWPLPWYYRGDGADNLTYLSTAGDNPEYFRDCQYDVIVSHNPDGFSAVPGYLKTDVIRQSYWFSIYDNRDRLAEYYLFRDGKLGSVNWNIFVLPETTGGAEIPVNATA